MLPNTFSECLPVGFGTRVQFAGRKAFHPLSFFKAYKLAVAAQNALVEHTAWQVRIPLVLEGTEMTYRDPCACGNRLQLNAALDPLLLKIPSEPHVHLRCF